MVLRFLFMFELFFFVKMYSEFYEKFIYKNIGVNPRTSTKVEILINLKVFQKLKIVIASK